MLTLYYERVSTDRQSESGLGLEAQRKRNAQVAALFELEQPSPHLGDMVHRNVFSDSGVSASVPFSERLAGRGVIGIIQDAIERAARNGRPDPPVTLIAYSLDRLFRDVDDGRAMLRWFDERGVKVLLSNEGGNAIDASSAMGRFLITIRLAQGELERGLTGERTKAALGALKDRCTEPGCGLSRSAHYTPGCSTPGPHPGHNFRGGRVGEPPFGWRSTTIRAQHEPDPEEQHIIALMLDMAAEGRSYRSIAAELNDLGHRTRDDKEFTHVQVSRVLQRLEEVE